MREILTVAPCPCAEFRIWIALDPMVPEVGPLQPGPQPSNYGVAIIVSRYCGRYLCELHACVYMDIFLCLELTCVLTYTLCNMHTCVHTYVYIYTYICIYVYVYVYIYIHTNVCTHICAFCVHCVHVLLGSGECKYVLCIWRLPKNTDTPWPVQVSCSMQIYRLFL